MSPHYPASSSSGAAGSPGPEVATTLFVGSISPGISDTWLTQLLEACGHMRSLKRASKAFAFAEYADPDSVLRAISVLNGRQLPSMGADVSAPAKKLLVKADEKTKRFLEQYEQNRLTHADDTRAETYAISTVDNIVRQMQDPNAVVEADPTRPGYTVPDHLKDLPPEELPEESRGTVLSEIEHFRQAAAARDAESRRKEAELERQRASERARIVGTQSSSSSSIRNGAMEDGPQSYRRPVEFQTSSRSQEVQVHRDPEEQDEIDWRRKQDANAARKQADAAEAERSYSVKERQRLARWEREADRQQADRDRSERDAVALLRKWEDWRDETATKRELFYTDRKRWRQFRASAREREEELDEQDRKAEAQEIVRAREESERFLAQQAEDMARLTEQQRASGVLVPAEGGGSLAPLKLTFSHKQTASDGQATHNNVNGASTAPITSVLGELDEDEREKRASRIKQISLTVEPSEEELQVKRQNIANSLPQDPAALFQQTPQWTHIDADAIDGQYRQWVDVEIEDSLGEKVEELVSVVIEALHAHKTAHDLIEAVEPVSSLSSAISRSVRLMLCACRVFFLQVLDDEAEVLVAKLWRMLLIDSLAASGMNR